MSDPLLLAASLPPFSLFFTHTHALFHLLPSLYIAYSHLPPLHPCVSPEWDGSSFFSQPNRLAETQPRGLKECSVCAGVAPLTPTRPAPKGGKTAGLCNGS